MKVLEPGHLYVVEPEQRIQFPRYYNGKLIAAGVTNEELIEVLIDRITFQNNKLPCAENATAIGYLSGALYSLKKRQAARKEQNVTHTEEAHVSKEYVLIKSSRIYYGGPAHAAPLDDHHLTDLNEAIALALASENPVGYDIYFKVPKAAEAQHPIWEYHNRDSYKEAVEQLDPLHDGVV